MPVPTSTARSPKRGNLSRRRSIGPDPAFAFTETSRVARRSRTDRRARFLVVAVAVATVACASRGGPPPGDATHDPEFERALRERDPEFVRQREALEAGLYETFVPPESVDLAAVAPASTPSLETERATVSTAPPSGEDPSTEELLRTLPPPPQGSPAPGAGRPADGAAPPAAEDVGAATWTVQLGAFADPAAARREAARANSVLPAADVRLTPRGSLTRVLLGRYRTRAEAEAAASEARRRGLGSAWVTTAEP